MKMLRPAEINFNGDAWSATHRLQWRRMVIYFFLYFYHSIEWSEFVFYAAAIHGQFYCYFIQFHYPLEAINQSTSFFFRLCYE